MPHHKAISRGMWGRSADSLALVDAARARNVDITIDQCPHTASQTGITAVAPQRAPAGGTNELIERLRDPETRRCIGSDGGVSVFGASVPHPREYGTFARVLGRYVRERGVLTLEEAVRKMSGATAQRLGLQDRGLLREGFFADITVLDPGRVIDRATFPEPHQYAEGIEYVLVNGTFVVDGGEHTGARPGRVPYGPGRR